MPTIDITPNPEYGTLQVGDRGDEVRRLQEELARYGYYEGDIDGVYGNQTRRAVEQFQYQHGPQRRRNGRAHYADRALREQPGAHVSDGGHARPPPPPPA